MEQTVITILTGYLVILSIAGFILMGMDKRRAVRKKWRIPEKTLILVAYLGGGIGAFLGMYVFRHKTRHRKFTILIPLAALLDLYLIIKMYHII
jgi:uncharacterized membrane protein YsdA (DUF1294 family)